MHSSKQQLPAQIAELKEAMAAVRAALAALTNAVEASQVGSFSLKEFRQRHRLSESQYHKLKREGRGPDEMSIGSHGRRISVAAERRWVEARERELAAGDVP